MCNVPSSDSPAAAIPGRIRAGVAIDLILDDTTHAYCTMLHMAANGSVQSYRRHLLRICRRMVKCWRFRQTPGDLTRSKSKGEAMQMRTMALGLVCIVFAGVVGADLAARQPATQPAASPATPKAGTLVELPEPRTQDGMSLNEALAKRKSIRSFTGQPLSREQINQICWAAQGITHQGNHRTAPSAGRDLPATGIRGLARWPVCLPSRQAHPGAGGGG